MTKHPKRNYDSRIDLEIQLIAYFLKHGTPFQVKEAKQRLQQWYRLQAEQESK